MTTAPSSSGAPRRSRTVEALLALEDDAPDVLFESVPGSPLPLWPQLRVAFGLALAAAELGEPENRSAVAQSRGAWRLASSLLPTRWDARRLRQRAELLFVTTGSSTWSVGGREEDWLVGDYARVVEGRSALVTWGRLPSPHGPPAFSPTGSLAPVMARAALRAAVTRLSGPAENAITSLVPEFARRLGIADEPAIARLLATARITERLRPALAARMERVIERLDPRVVIMQNASYGGQAHLVHALHAAGIRVAEPQHGWIGPSHYAYNHGAAMRTPELAATLPDELLTFGEFWSEGVAHAAPATAIGRPRLELIASGAPPADERPQRVLVVSSATEPAATEALVLDLVAALPPGWSVGFRPHPAERAEVDRRYPRLRGAAGVELDLDADLYGSLTGVRAVIGTASTVLYEALALGCRVFVIDSPKGPYYVGEVFGPRLEPQEAVAAVIAGLSEGAGLSRVQRDLLPRIWRPGALDAFRDWASAASA